jgi:hypothetical protein
MLWQSLLVRFGRLADLALLICPQMNHRFHQLFSADFQHLSAVP